MIVGKEGHGTPKKVIFLPESSVLNTPKVKEINLRSISPSPAALLPTTEFKFEIEPNFKHWKKTAAALLKFMDKPLLRFAAKLIINHWLRFRDKALPDHKKFTIGRLHGVWYCKQGNLYTTHRELYWSMSPMSSLEETEDELFNCYHPKSGDTVVSIGAGTGVNVLASSLCVGENGKVIAIEGDAATFRALSVCCHLNELKNVKLYPAVISEDSTPIITKNKVQVSPMTMEKLAKKLRLQKVDFLMINIGGSEREILAGMDQIIKKVKNICICCHDFKADIGGSDKLRTQQLVIDYLESHGFITFTRPDSPIPWVRSNVYAKNLSEH